MPGPLEGLRVLELGGIGPGPHAAMILGDLGADVVRVDRPSTNVLTPVPEKDQLLRNRRSVTADLKDPDDLARVLTWVDDADVLIEGFRPGVAERIGIGPDECRHRNPRLVYGRMTGWGQDGAMSHLAGHDLNFVAITGVLSAIAREGQPPTVPLNLVGDYGGGSMLLLVGILAALWERERSGEGQVIDASMVDGIALLSQAFWSLRGRGEWVGEPASNVVDGGAPFYDVYECADGGHLAIAPLEPGFYSILLERLGLSSESLPPQFDRARWPELREHITHAVKVRSRDEWTAVFADTDACVTPVLSFDEAEHHQHLRSRGTLIDVGGVVQAAPAPRFSRTPPETPRPPRRQGQDNDALSENGWGDARR
ncbi:carnitine dehydratase [Aeromicrobium sp. PE09-221]|uniref:CaiB/BaiF CoA transferase family protein n=1 Tax=Aeromicrobium sp. PE09-221 TaxID=1898043 RepID=UPI000B3E8A8C|nr:CaiB/BaiF CoA-transferase family protein [Aeromicrobium sp. PE09-221]OUZ10132.1 carnitine dehydratase [Aeromicrobium sp. PE09-221]